MRFSPITLIQGDALAALKAIPACKVDAVITDPPYGIAYSSTKGETIANDKHPFIWWLHDAFRITKPGGCLLCFTRWDVEDVFKMAIEAAGYKLKSQVIWDKVHHGMGDVRGQYAPQHENLWFATKSKFHFHAKRPRSIRRASKLHGRKMVHPTQKPEGLMATLIEDVVPRRGYVCDPFMGSGSTAVACVHSKRRFIGIEQDGGHFRTGVSRVKKSGASPAFAKCRSGQLVPMNPVASRGETDE